MWAALINWVIRILENLHELTGEWGYAIILFTLLIRLITHPLNKKQMDSMQKMQRLQPKMKILQEKFKDDREALSDATMQLYKENNINPVAGCLPLLVQLPILILLFQALNTLVSTEGFSATFLGVDLGESVYTAVVAACNATTAGLSEEVIRGLAILHSLPPIKIGMFNVGYAIIENPAGLLNFGFYAANLILLLTIGFLTWYQQKLTSSGNPQMAAMNIMMPIVFTWICLSFPGGVLLYWGASSLIGVAQQVHTSKRTKKEMAEKPVLYKDKPMGNR